MQHLRDVVDRRRVGSRHHGLLVDVAHQRDLLLHRGRDLAVGAADDRVGLDADGAQRGHRVLGRLGLELARRPDPGHQGDVQEEDVVATDVVAHLAGGLQERQRLDVADRAADLGDHDVDVVAAHGQDAVLDLVGDVRDHLDRVAEVVAATLLGDHLGVDLPGRDVGDLAEVGVQEALVVPDVEVGLGAVVGDEHLAVLERVHRPGIDVEVGVELLHGHPQPARAEQATEAGGGEPLAERGGDSTRHEDVLGRLRCYQEGSPWARVAPAAGARVRQIVRSSTGFEPTNDFGPHVPRGEFSRVSGVLPRRPRRLSHVEQLLGVRHRGVGLLEPGEHPGELLDPAPVVEDGRGPRW